MLPHPGKLLDTPFFSALPIMRGAPKASNHYSMDLKGSKLKPQPTWAHAMPLLLPITSLSQKMK